MGSPSGRGSGGHHGYRGGAPGAGRRLRAAGVGEETRRVLLGHANGEITTHYSAPDLAEPIGAVNKIDRSLATPAITLLRAVA